MENNKPSEIKIKEDEKEEITFDAEDLRRIKDKELGNKLWEMYKKGEAKEVLSPEQIKDMLSKQYEDIIKVLKEYSDIKKEYYPIVALWVIGTYMHDNFSTFPYLFFNAMKGSGKTRLLKLISHLGFGGNGKVQTGLTQAVLFRSTKGTLLVLDEMESIKDKGKGELREYLNACYKKGATVSRTKKVKKLGEENYEIEEFEPYRPIAMANIYGMEDVLGDRCITLILERSNNPLFIKKVENFDENPLIKSISSALLSNQCRVCSVVMVKKLLTTWNNYIDDKYTTTYTTNSTLTTLTTQELQLFNKIDEAGIDGRYLELSFPLLLIANFLSDDLLDETIRILKEEVQIKKEEQFSDNYDISLIDFVSTHSNLEFISVKKLTDEFRNYLRIDPSDRDNEINVKWLGAALKRLKLSKDKRRKSYGVEVKLNIEKAQEKIKMFK